MNEKSVFTFLLLKHQTYQNQKLNVIMGYNKEDTIIIFILLVTAKKKENKENIIPTGHFVNLSEFKIDFIAKI